MSRAPRPLPLRAALFAFASAFALGCAPHANPFGPPGGTDAADDGGAPDDAGDVEGGVDPTTGAGGCSVWGDGFPWEQTPSPPFPEYNAVTGNLRVEQGDLVYSSRLAAVQAAAGVDAGYGVGWLPIGFLGTSIRSATSIGTMGISGSDPGDSPATIAVVVSGAKYGFWRRATVDDVDAKMAEDAAQLNCVGGTCACDQTLCGYVATDPDNLGTIVQFKNGEWILRDRYKPWTLETKRFYPNGMPKSISSIYGNPTTVTYDDPDIALPSSRGPLNFTHIVVQDQVTHAAQTWTFTGTGDQKLLESVSSFDDPANTVGKINRTWLHRYNYTGRDLASLLLPENYGQAAPVAATPTNLMDYDHHLLKSYRMVGAWDSSSVPDKTRSMDPASGQDSGMKVSGPMPEDTYSFDGAGRLLDARYATGIGVHVDYGDGTAAFLTRFGRKAGNVSFDKATCRVSDFTDGLGKTAHYDYAANGTRKACTTPRFGAKTELMSPTGTVETTMTDDELAASRTASDPINDPALQATTPDPRNNIVVKTVGGKTFRRWTRYDKYHRAVWENTGDKSTYEKYYEPTDPTLSWARGFLERAGSCESMHCYGDSADPNTGVKCSDVPTGSQMALTYYSMWGGTNDPAGLNIDCKEMVGSEPFYAITHFSADHTLVVEDMSNRSPYTRYTYDPNGFLESNRRFRWSPSANGPDGGITDQQTVGGQLVWHYKNTLPPIANQIDTDIVSWTNSQQWFGKVTNEKDDLQPYNPSTGDILPDSYFYYKSPVPIAKWHFEVGEWDYWMDWHPGAGWQYQEHVGGRNLVGSVMQAAQIFQPLDWTVGTDGGTVVDRRFHREVTAKTYYPADGPGTTDLPAGGWVLLNREVAKTITFRASDTNPYGFQRQNRGKKIRNYVRFNPRAGW